MSKNNNKFQEKNIIRLSNNDRHFKIQKHKIQKYSNSKRSLSNLSSVTNIIISSSS